LIATSSSSTFQRGRHECEHDATGGSYDDAYCDADYGDEIFNVNVVMRLHIIFNDTWPLYFNDVDDDAYAQLTWHQLMLMLLELRGAAIC
jgi:hypothetical protein